MNEKISVVIPCYNSELTIQKVVEDTMLTLTNGGYNHFEFILVNDNSKDNTFKVIKSLCEKYDNITGITLSRNFGQHGALMSGYHEVTGDIVLCMDDDGQTRPSEVLKLIGNISDDVDAVYAKYADKKHNIFRNFGTLVNNLMAASLLNKPKNLFISSFFATKRYVIDEVIKYDNSFPYVFGLVNRTTDKMINVDVDHNSREEGKSGYTLSKLLGLWFNGFTSFSVKPLRISMVLGFIFAIFGFGFVIDVIYNKIVNAADVVTGWSSLVSIILISNGVMMIMLGLIGEYLGRAFISLNKAPQYIVKDKVTSKNKD